MTKVKNALEDVVGYYHKFSTFQVKNICMCLIRLRLVCYGREMDLAFRLPILSSTSSNYSTYHAVQIVKHPNTLIRMAPNN